jgi:large subunit ribosomal protein L32e
MADEKDAAPASSDAASAKAPKKARAKPASDAGADAPKSTPKSSPKSEGPKAPRRPTLDPELRRLLAERADRARRTPIFGRQAANRYWRIGRWGSWRRPRGLQSKQRRHYGYRAKVVRIGYGSPARTRGRTPTGFIPIIVRTAKDVAAIEASGEAAIIARTVGTRRRLVLEEACRKRGIHILNPIVQEREES